MKNKFRFKALSPWLLLIIAFITYGLLIRNLGLYWDDFPYTWFGHALGPSQYARVFFNDRPLLTGLYNITAPIFGENILSWQIFAIVMRWLCALCVGWIVGLIWPTRNSPAFVASLLFLVYPGFGQQWISTIYSRGFVLLLLYLLSFGFMVKSIRVYKKQRLYMVLSLLLGASSLLSTEYYFGLEFSRPVIIWILVNKEEEKVALVLKKIIIKWLPYLVVALAYAIWRGRVVTSVLYGIRISDAVSGGVPGLILSFVENMAVNAYKGGLSAWIRIFSLPPVKSWSQPFNFSLIILIVGMLCFSAIILWKSQAKKEGPSIAGKLLQNWQLQALILGIVMLLGGSFPFWLANLRFDLIFPYDRFTLAMMFGSALMLVGLIYLLPHRWTKVTIISLLVAFSTGWHFQTAKTYYLDWKQLISFAQQLTWRMPGIKPGTALVAYDLPFNYYSDNSLTAVVNWVYSPDLKSGHLPYVLDYLTVRDNGALSRLEPNIEITQKYRAFEFHGNTSNMIVLYKTQDSCLKILDLTYNGVDTIPNLKDPLPTAIRLSNLDRIITDAEYPTDSPIPRIIKTSETMPWCYYFQKAELARQVLKWRQINKLWGLVESNSLKPDNISEYYPFIEGIAMDGDIQKAIDITRLVNSKKPSLHKALCQIWGRIENERNWEEINQKSIDNIKEEIRCKP